MSKRLYQRRASVWALGLAEAEAESLTRAALAPAGKNIEQTLELSSLTPAGRSSDESVSLVALWKRRSPPPEP